MFCSQISAIDVLLNIFSNINVVEKYVMPDAQSTIVTKATCLVNSISDWTIIPLTRVCLAKIIQLFSYIVQYLNNKEVLDVSNNFIQ